MRTRQVDGVNRRTPSQQPRQWRHLGKGAEQREVLVRQVEPFRMGLHARDGRDERRFAQSIVEPAIQLAPQRIAAEQLAAQRDRQRGRASRATADDGARRERRPRRGHGVLERRFAAAAHETQALAHRVQPGKRDVLCRGR
ncbi:MAG: hypothetical protein ACM32F_09040 [Betaproteobacteria bacterium]